MWYDGIGQLPQVPTFNLKKQKQKQKQNKLI